MNFSLVIMQLRLISTFLMGGKTNQFGADRVFESDLSPSEKLLKPKKNRLKKAGIKNIEECQII